MDSLDKLNIYKLKELDGKQTSTLEADQCPCEATFCHLWMIMVFTGGSQGPEEGGSGELMAD